MAGRLKRRSSIGFGNRRDSLITAPDPGTPEMFTQDDDEERRVRNLQRRQAKNLEAGVTSSDSPAMERAGSSNRRSIGGISGLTAAQLAEHYNNCIKLSAENKISTKNAFNLQLIDYMATMIKKKESDMNNFQVAAGTLDASTKIYAYRVDSVYGDTLKIAGGLGQAGKQDQGELGQGEGGDEAAEDGEANPDQPKKKRRTKKSATVEKNLKNINVNKFELEFDVDPLFKKTSSQFDSGSGGNQFVATLQVRDDTCELLLDSDKVLERVNTGATPVKESPFGSHSEVTGFDFGRLDATHVCPTFADFNFKWSLDNDSQEEDEYLNRLNESISASQDERNASRMDSNENAFDAFAVPEHGDDDGMADHDHDGDQGVDDMERTEWSERAVGHTAAAQRPGFTASLPMTSADMLSVLTTAPLEYSYFDHGKLGAWAGPKHWKFKPISKPATEEGEKTKAKKKKDIHQINYDDYDGNTSDNEEYKEMCDKLKVMLTVPKKSVKLVEKTMKGWNRDKNTLPEDLHYSGHELVRLKTVDRMVIQNKTNTDQGTRVEVEDYNYENAADREGFCPDLDDQDAYGDAVEDNLDTMTETLANETEDQEVPDLTMGGELYTGDNLVAAPKLVDKAALQIGYAKTAKKVDMKRLKVVAWDILNKASIQDKENRSASPEKQVDKDNKEDEGTQFSKLYKIIKQPSKIGRTMADNLSVPLAFIALLHLCNEENLSLKPSDNMEDFTISMP